jgi:UDP-glucose 4-epimerase
MHVLVTGGAGFIGSNLVDRLLAEGHRVDVIDDLSSGKLANLADARSGDGHDFSFHQIDICDPAVVELIERRSPEVICHLAAQIDVRVSVSDPLLDARMNILGTINILEGARRAGTRKVTFASSGGTIYGNVDPEDLPIKESQPLAPVSPYGVSKMSAVAYMHAYRELHDLEYTALALANVYGPRQDPHGEAGVVAIFAGRLLEGEGCTIFGDGEQTRDYVFVDDVVDAFVRAMEKGGGLTCNIGTGVETSVNELHAAMARNAGVDAPPEYAPARAGELDRSSLDASRAGIHLGWEPFTDLATGTAAVIDWFRDRSA